LYYSEICENTYAHFKLKYNDDTQEKKIGSIILKLKIKKILNKLAIQLTMFTLCSVLLTKILPNPKVMFIFSSQLEGEDMK